MKLIVIDCETTGTDVFEDRVVTAFAGVWDTEKEGWSARMEFLVNPGIPIPEEATAVHGITNEAASEGMPPEEFLELLFDFLQNYADLPVVAYNANYDLSLINAELERYGFQAYDWNKRQIIDPLVLERHYNKYKKGKKRLVDIVAQRGIKTDESRLHSASYDCEMTARIVDQQFREWGTHTNEQQAQMHADWAESFEQWIRGTKGDPEIVIDRGWPVRSQ